MRKTLEISSHLQMFELCIACLGYIKVKYILWELRRASSVVASNNLVVFPEEMG